VTINGESVELPKGATVRDAVREAGAEPRGRGVAVAVDGEVVPRSQIETRPLEPGQRVEVVAAIQGGG
jgi:sulfur carrier protein